MSKKWTLVLSNRPEFMDFIVAEILSLAEQFDLGTEFFTPQGKEVLKFKFLIY